MSRKKMKQNIWSTNEKKSSTSDMSRFCVYTKTRTHRSLFSVFRVLQEMLSLFHRRGFENTVKFLRRSLCRCRGHHRRTRLLPPACGSHIMNSEDRAHQSFKYTRVADSCWPGVVLLSSPLIGVGLVVALVAQHVGRDVVDLNAGRVVQHFQVLKHRLTDLLQILQTREHSERVGRLHVRISTVHFTPMKRGMTLLPVGSSGFLSWCWHQGATWSLEQSTQNTLQTNQIRQTGCSKYFCSLSFLFHPQSSVMSRVATLRVTTNWLLICCLCINHFSGSLWHPGQQERTKTIQRY